MKNQLLVERFQKLAGIASLKEDQGTLSHGTDELSEGREYDEDEIVNLIGAETTQIFMNITDEVVDKTGANSGVVYDYVQEQLWPAYHEAAALLIRTYKETLTRSIENFQSTTNEGSSDGESNGALSSQVEAWLIEEIKAHDATDTGINGEFELGITERYYGHDPMARKLMGEMEQLGEITLNIEAADVYHDAIEDIKVSSVESNYVVAKWGNYVSDDEDEWIEA